MLKLTSTLIIVLLVVTACTPGSTENSFYKAGTEKLDNSQYSEALEQFKLAIDFDSSNTDAYLKAADILIPKAKYKQTIEILELGAKAAKDKSAIKSKLGYVYFLKGDYENSLQNYNQALEINNNNIEAAKGKLRVLSLTGDNKNLSEFAANSSASDQELAMMKGIALVDNYEDSQKFLSEAEQGSNENIAAVAKDLKQMLSDINQEKAVLLNYTNIAYKLIENGWTSISFPVTNKVIEINEYYEGGYLYRGVIYLDTGNLEQAQKDFEKALTLNPDQPEVHLLLATTYFKAQMKPKAKQSLNQLKAYNNFLLNYIEDIVNLDLEFGQPAQAKNFINLYKASKSELSNDVVLLEVKTLVELADYQAAVNAGDAYLEELEAYDNDFQSNYLSYLGYANYKIGNKALGQEMLTKAKVIDRTNATAFLYDGELQLDEGNIDEAKSSLERAIDLDFKGKITAKANTLLNQI